MLFYSFDYLLCFLPAVWLLYLILRHTRFRTTLLIISGYVFYGWAQPWIVILLFLSSTTDYLIGLRLEVKEGAAARRALLIASLCFKLGLLGIFKYSAWLIGNINQVLISLHIGTYFHEPKLSLPPGISFYTFQSLSYIIDIYRRRLHAHRKIGDYWAFVAFFPQLFAGPIERTGHLLPQIVHPRKRIHPRMIEMGLFMIGWGLFKKLVVADNLSGVVEVCRSNMALQGAAPLLALAFTFQIYADFSGYTDIARGSAKLLGISLRRNFKTPYFARNPSEFWQRWHMSLSTWIRDYIYIPLGGNRLGSTRTVINLLVTMFLAGLWHGAGWYFVVWGLYHGLLLCLYNVWPIEKWLKASMGKVGDFASILFMFLLVVAGWVLFYLGESGSASKVFFPEHPETPSVSIFQIAYGIMLFSLPVILTDWLGFRKKREFTDLWPHMSGKMKAFLYLCIFYGILLFGARESNEFIYFHF